MTIEKVKKGFFNFTKIRARCKKFLFYFLIFIFFILIFRSVFFEIYKIPSGSMLPTLTIGDLVLVNKMAYGLKVPFTDINVASKNFNPIYLFGKKDPERGDVVVFKYPKNLGLNYIKRVVGVPGDIIKIKNKVLFVNNRPVSQKEISDPSLIKGLNLKFKRYDFKYYQAKTGEASHVIQKDSDNFFQMNFAKKKVPPGKFFVMGDNRDFSYDSRFWGFVPHEYIKGKATHIVVTIDVTGKRLLNKMNSLRSLTKID